ncbi:carbohydrate ABC transporter permease [Enterococcus nangangensis]|uniref:carbohydrate ABC transporter permease n=1 Tax=Enterococcus nangangensis TaxID=2559926 RepID=UPI0010F5EA86|nr:sugar ABC transporter permease [Enterococcus nangangensis]
MKSPTVHRKRKKDLTPYFLLAPTVLLIVCIMVYPVARVFYLSMQNYDLSQVWKDGFAGFDNYRKLFTDEQFWQSAKLTLKWVLTQVVAQLILGVIVALLLNQKFKGRGLARTVALVPWAVSGVLVTMLWTLMFDQTSGLLNDLLMKAGIIHEKVAWLANDKTVFGAISVAELWRGIPFFAINILAGLQSIPGEIYESSAMDGCGPIRNFIYITLPYLKESIIFATLLRGIWEFNSIDMIFTMTNGGPMNKTTTLPIFMMKTAIIKGNYGYGSAIGVVTFLMLGVVSILYVRAMNRKEKV